MSRKPDEHLLYEPLADGDGAILDVRDHRFYTLNETARVVFELARAGHDLAAITVAIRRTYDVDEETCRRHVARILEELSAAEML